MNKEDKLHYLALGLIVALGAFVRFWDIGKHPLWMDEAYSYWFSQLPFYELWFEAPAYETHPPFYYTLLKIWIAFFGTSETAMRSLSATAGVCAIPAMYMLGRVAAGGKHQRTAGLAASAIFAFAPVNVLYSQEARPYSLLCLAVAVCLYGALWLAANPAEAAKPLLGSSGKGEGSPPASAKAAWICLIAGTAGALWLHNVAVLLPAVLLITVAAGLAVRLRFSRTFLSNAAMAGGAILLLWSPFLPWFYIQSTTVRSSFWLDGADMEYVTAGLKHIFFLYFPSGQFQWVIVALAAVGFAMTARERGWLTPLSLAVIMVLPLALVISITFWVKPVFVPRTLVWTVIPFHVFAGAAFALDIKKVYKAPLLLFVSASLLYGCAIYYDVYKKEPWREMVAGIASRAGKEDTVILVPSSIEIPFAYYRDRISPGLAARPLPKPYPALGLDRPYPSGNSALPALTREDAPLFENVSCQSSGVWLVMRSPWLFDPAGVALENVSGKCRFVEKWETGNIFIYQFAKQNEG